MNEDAMTSDELVLQLQAEVERLRAALEEDYDCECHHCYKHAALRRAALAKEDR